ncbi:hypothetical protein DPMN_127272 [Dreissena polymorpha]|uniref:Uncharacterized protein n=1 Tax=Dreissena polymorpha TaxID=45954 RepID=A0A9D4JYP1_DREPO|nr:hypothetical protein DPMN_127272 [Dreissena polymorpha]
MNKLVLVLLLVGCVALLTLPPQVEAWEELACTCRHVCEGYEAYSGSCRNNQPGIYCCNMFFPS